MLRNAVQRRRAAREIDRLVAANPGLIAFPLWRVGYVEGITPRRRRVAVVTNIECGKGRAA